ncbi:MAG: DEAD/DEAH box helicase [Chthoniobacterales bacterium]
MSGLQIPLEIPDLWQQEAVAALRNGRDVIVDAPTGAGKTRIFEMLVESGYTGKKGQAIYTVPTRALANDNGWSGVAFSVLVQEMFYG